MYDKTIAEFIFISAIFIILPIIIIVIRILASPFHFPLFTMEFDVTGKRRPRIDDYIDEFLIHGGKDRIEKYELYLQEWKNSCEKIIQESKIPDYRREQYGICLAEAKNNYKFTLVRSQTRYKQVNYVKHPYKVKQEVCIFECDLDYLNNRDRQLKEIGYECTLSTYFAKDQRKKMTKELRLRIKKRDNYTCQICGKYMPDEVGLHIDHIRPIAKGGKSVPSNLRVLCSKCNGSKGDKIV